MKSNLSVGLVTAAEYTPCFAWSIHPHRAYSHVALEAILARGVDVARCRATSTPRASIASSATCEYARCGWIDHAKHGVYSAAVTRPTLRLLFIVAAVFAVLSHVCALPAHAHVAM